MKIKYSKNYKFLKSLFNRELYCKGKMKTLQSDKVYNEILRKADELKISNSDKCQLTNEILLLIKILWHYNQYIREKKYQIESLFQKNQFDIVRFNPNLIGNINYNCKYDIKNFNKNEREYIKETLKNPEYSIGVELNGDDNVLKIENNSKLETNQNKLKFYKDIKIKIDLVLKLIKEFLDRKLIINNMLNLFKEESAYTCSQSSQMYSVRHLLKDRDLPSSDAINGKK